MFIYSPTDLVEVSVTFNNSVKGFTFEEVENVLSAALIQVRNAKLLAEQSGPKNALHFRVLQIPMK